MKPLYTTITVARGITVLFMPAIHTVMLYSRPEVYQAYWILFLRFFAEGPGAQLFMFIMGFLLPLGRPKTGSYVFRRALTLWLAGYILNFFRIYLPARLGLFEPEMLHYYHAGAAPHPYLPLLLTGDILQFAGIAYGAVGGLYRLVSKKIFLIFLYIVIAGTAPFVWGIRAKNEFVDHVLALFFANDHHAFFPLFPWLCYPLAGLIVGMSLKGKVPSAFLEKLAWLGLGLMMLGIILIVVLPLQWEGDFYRSSPGKTIAYTGFILLWLYGINRCLSLIATQNLLIRLLSFCGRRITAIYCFHWILVGWSFPLFGYHHLNTTHSILVLGLISFLSIGIPLLYYKRYSTILQSKIFHKTTELTYETTRRV